MILEETQRQRRGVRGRVHSKTMCIYLKSINIDNSFIDNRFADGGHVVTGLQFEWRGRREPSGGHSVGIEDWKTGEKIGLQCG